jgi:hypothetical protein
MQDQIRLVNRALRAFSSGEDAREHLVTRNLPSAIDGARPDR